MMKLTCFLMACFSFCTAIASDELNTAALLQVNAPDDLSGIPLTLQSFTPSAEPSCLAAANDVWFTFEATSTAIHILCLTTEIDVQFELYDSTLDNLLCVNATTGYGSESQVFSALVTGQTYFVRVGLLMSLSPSSNCMVIAQNMFFEYPAVLPVPGNDPCGWNTNTLAGIGALPYQQNWQWEFLAVDGSTFVWDTNSSNSFVQIGSYPDATPGESFSVRFRCFAADNWCPWSNYTTIQMHPFSKTRLQQSFCETPLNLGNFITAEGALLADFYTFRLTTDNGETVIERDSPSNTIFLDSFFPEIKYGKIYSVVVKVSVNGVEGPYSDPCILIIIDLPHTNIVADDCNGILQNFMNLQPVPEATDYWVRAYPTSDNDPTLFPIGPAVILSTNGNAITNFSGVQFLPATTYVIQAKAHVFDQQGDYGPPCIIYIPAIDNENEESENEGSSNNPQLSNLVDLDSKISVSTFPNEWVFNTKNSVDFLEGVEVHSISGRLISQHLVQSNQFVLSNTGLQGVLILKLHLSSKNGHSQEIIKLVH